MVEKKVKQSETRAKKATEFDHNGFGIVGVIMGILSVLSLSIGGTVMGVVGLVFSMQQKKREANSWSKAGIILNWIGIILGIVATTLIISFSEQLGITG